ncbi:rna-directed dna polymerase from mobile element jockey-like [Limosa lapponica baueri]|uniref:Rna-directed dna polymerase from mobile element jockey-like n=1 Tax=Limosa lapponica baueri TaxID=1758121 RepID=A0A2I0TYP3_LIMLA|nr:rna-directed dna polymerase from mobile element jockey-like [Limosa lapponica baueri]
MKEKVVMEIASIDVQRSAQVKLFWDLSWDLTLFKMRTSDLEEEKQWTLIKFVHATKLEDEVNVLYGRAAIQGDIVRLEEWANMNLIKFRKD